MQECIPAIFYSEDDGKTWTNPQAILPGILAAEPDFVELPNGDLLIINSLVQHGAAARQYIHKTRQGWVPGPVFKIEPDAVPESVCCTSDGLLVGSRRCGPYSCSNDEGDTWYEIEGLPICGYQPRTIELKDGRFLTAWHMYGDCCFGEYDQFVGAHIFSLERTMPGRTKLELWRDLNEKKTKYLNSFTATLTADGKPIPGRKVVFTIQHRYRDTYGYGTASTPEPYPLEAVTDREGQAQVHLEYFDRERQIHSSYSIRASFTPGENDLALAPCESSRIEVYGVTAERGVGNPYPLYVSGELLFLRKDVAACYPEIENVVKSMQEPREFTLADAILELGLDQTRVNDVLQFLVDNFILDKTDTGYRWRYRLSGGWDQRQGIGIIEIEDDFV
jgi:hypothetical protein